MTLIARIRLKYRLRRLAYKLSVAALESGIQTLRSIQWPSAKSTT